MTSDQPAEPFEGTTPSAPLLGPLVHRGGRTSVHEPGHVEFVGPLALRASGGEAGSVVQSRETPAAGEVAMASDTGAVSTAVDEIDFGVDDSLADALRGDTAGPDADAAEDEEVDLPWLTTQEDEQMLDVATAEVAEGGEVVEWSEPEFVGGAAERGIEAGERDASANSDPALRVAERLERIAASLRARGAAGPDRRGAPRHRGAHGQGQLLRRPGSG